MTSDNIRNRAYGAMKTLIMNNELKPSASYLESELAARLGVSRTPVREAMLQLEREGFVEVRPRHGMRVLPVSAEDMSEIYDILSELEPLAAELAAKRGPSDAELSALQVCIDTMEEALQHDDLQAWAEADDEFHRLLVDYSDSTRLRKTVSQFRDQVHRARMATLSLRVKPTESNKDHQILVNHLRQKNAPEARKIHRAHRVKAGQMLVELLTKHGLNNL
ncbi:MAG: GntR family transcriptional regulator [Pseudomonadota bacterium]